MPSRNWIWKLLLTGCLLGLAPQVPAAPFGRVVAIGGQAADLALDEARGVLYIANFTANRIEVMSLADGVIARSLNVAPQPSSLSLSPDGRWLLIAHFGAVASGQTPRNSLTLIDLNTDSRQNFALGAAPLGVSFTFDGLALVVTASEFLLFDPLLGTTTLLDTIAAVVGRTIPAPPANFPLNFTAAAVTATPDGRTVVGLTDTIRFRYDAATRGVAITNYTSSPTFGPRVVSVNDDATRISSGWGLFDDRGSLLAQHPSPLGTLNVGSNVIDSRRGIIYSQVPTGRIPVSSTPSGSGSGSGGSGSGSGTGTGGAGTGGTGATATADSFENIMQIVDVDNLTVRERIQLSENFAGRGVLTPDGETAYVISESGVTILPVGQLAQQRRVSANVEDLLFQGNFCDRRITSQEFVISDASGGATDFRLAVNIPGVTVTPSSGVTPATIRVSVDPTLYANNRGTVQGQITIASTGAINQVRSVRLLINNREPDQRGLTINQPGRLVDILADPARDRFFVLRQDTNEILVFDGTSYQLITRWKTTHTPHQLAFTFDRRFLMVSSDNSQIIPLFDLETLQPVAPIRMPVGHYPRAVAATGRGVLALSRIGSNFRFSRADLTTRQATELPSLGVWENNLSSGLPAVLIPAPNGSRVLMAHADGNLLLYDANPDTFTISRRETTPLVGAIAASGLDQFVVGNAMLNSSLVTTRRFDASSGNTSGFVFVDNQGIRFTASQASGPGVLQRVDLTTAGGARATRTIEAPVLADEINPFTRTVAVLPSRNAIVTLTQSGFTVLPWNFDAAVAPPRIDRVVNSADLQRPVAPGGLVSLFGQNMSPVNAATRQIPLPTALGESCLTVNGMPVPLIFVSESQVNAQLPFTIEGNTTMVLRTPGGVSDNFNLQILSAAPGIFRQSVEGLGEVPSIINGRNGLLATGSNPIRRNDSITIYLTGLGRTFPAIEEGLPGPSEPLATAVVPPVVTIGGQEIIVNFAGLAPGQVGVYQINARIPGTIPTGQNLPLTIAQGGVVTTVPVRVIE